MIRPAGRQGDKEIMPTKRRKRSRHRIAEISDTARWLASDGLFPRPEHIDLWERMYLGSPTVHSCADRCRNLWQSLREEILTFWIGENPATRPAWWWLFDAPELRQRLGGVGDPAHKHLAHVPHHEYGIPVSWVQPWDVEYYNGRAVDVHGNRISTKFTEGDFKGVAVDPSHPPIYESQAAYLRRLNLLEPVESRRLKPSDFEPEELDPEWWSEKNEEKESE